MKPFLFKAQCFPKPPPEGVTGSQNPQFNFMLETFGFQKKKGFK